MKFIMYKKANTNHLGVILEKGLIDVNQVLEKEFKDLNDFIINHQQQDIDKLMNYSGKSYLNKDDLDIINPILKPVNDIICVGLNYKEHAKESTNFLDGKNTKMSKTVYFQKKCHQTITNNDLIDGHFDINNQLDYEGELLVIIKKDAYQVSVEEADDYIFGFSVFNDISARALQREHSQWLMGKSLDTFCAIANEITYYDGSFDYQNLDITTKVNGILRQNSNTSLMIHSIKEMISELTQGITLEAGDLIATGTPSGVGAGFNPPRFLQANDEIEITIEKIGTLKNKVK